MINITKNGQRGICVWKCDTLRRNNKFYIIVAKNAECLPYNKEERKQPTLNWTTGMANDKKNTETEESFQMKGNLTASSSKFSFLFFFFFTHLTESFI